MEKYHEALYLEFNVLALVIDRNRKQHQRAAYFRRLDMLYRCIQKYMFPKEESNNTTLIDILHTVKNKKIEYESLLTRHIKIQKRQRQDQWSLDATPNSTKDPFLIHLQKLHQSIHQELPEILSRIMYAAEALYKELSRGYFAPLCTVCLASISRIRTLILRLGRDIYIILQNVHSWLTGDFCFVEKGSNLEKDILYVNQVHDYLKECPLMSNVLDRYQDVNIEEYEQKKHNLQKEMILNRLPGFKCMTENDKDLERKDDEMMNGENQLQEGNSRIESEKDNIGELIHDAYDDSSATREEQATAISTNDFGDTNLEMVQLLKQKTKSKTATTSKKRKLDSREDESSDSIIIKNKKTKSKKKRSKDEEKVKDKKKKKKKKVKRDAIDDIFDGF
ncbi:hypothetical protein CTEN210_17996 [Chaetoceros tenuissimus]|uniref:Nucleolus and neural progenitor protein-like N-terminal domain-containing protein n=1 Tax=Chaetoceros tenuissimus TaxID=426638 RepID=A0AAD3HFA4_9STRA|nr:hypothetical protein CTEN210_17996 [Chaetoceros tenuissimus]